MPGLGNGSSTTDCHLVFRQLSYTEEDRGYQVICDSVDWQKAKRIKLWETPLPRELYAQRHERGENFGLFANGKLAVVTSLIVGVPKYWAKDVEDPEARWLCALATARDFHGRCLGQTAVEKALDYLRETGRTEVYLDCKPGFLEGFYERLGFCALAQQQIPIPNSPGKVWDCVLMRKHLTV